MAFREIETHHFLVTRGIFLKCSWLQTVLHQFYCKEKLAQISQFLHLRGNTVVKLL